MTLNSSINDPFEVKYVLTQTMQDIALHLLTGLSALLKFKNNA